MKSISVCLMNGFIRAVEKGGKREWQTFRTLDSSRHHHPYSKSKSLSSLFASAFNILAVLRVFVNELQRHFPSILNTHMLLQLISIQWLSFDKLYSHRRDMLAYVCLTNWTHTQTYMHIHGQHF